MRTPLVDALPRDDGLGRPFCSSYSRVNVGLRAVERTK